MSRLSFDHWRATCPSTFDFRLSCDGLAHVLKPVTPTPFFTYFSSTRPLIKPRASPTTWTPTIHYIMRAHCQFSRNSVQGRSVRIRTYARAYSWNLENIYFSFPESIFITKSGWLINLSHYILVSLPVWRVDISPFACNLLDSVTVVPFSRKHYTLPIIAFSFVFIYWKCLAENAGNGISEPLNLKHILGSMSVYLPSLQYPASEVQSFFPCVHLQNLTLRPCRLHFPIWRPRTTHDEGEGNEKVETDKLNK